MISYWIGEDSRLALCIHLTIISGYGTNYIGGTGEGQSNAAWLIPVCIQLLPAVVLGVGIMFMPQRYCLPDYPLLFVLWMIL